jgi:hypothetical protein
MKTYPGANRGKGIAFPVEFQRFGVPALAYQGYESGNIHRRGTGALARRPNQPRTNPGSAMVIPDVFFELMPEVANCR